MKRVLSKKWNKKEPEVTPDLSSFALEAALLSPEATSFKAPTSFSPRKVFSFPSQQSLATNPSFSTAIEPSPSATPAASYYHSVGSNSDNDDDDTSTTTTTPKQFLPISITNIKETMASSKLMSKIKGKTTPMPAIAVVPKSAPVIKATPASDDEAKFDVTQTIYGASKDVWAFGKTVPIITHILGITDAVAMKALDVTFHVDYAAVDDKIKPHLKKLDDGLFTPPIAAVWRFVEPVVKFVEPFVEPVVKTADNYIAKPFMNQVVPKVMSTLHVGDDKKMIDTI